MNIVIQAVQQLWTGNTAWRRTVLASVCALLCFFGWSLFNGSSAGGGSKTAPPVPPATYTPPGAPASTGSSTITSQDLGRLRSQHGPNVTYMGDVMVQPSLRHEDVNIKRTR